MKKRWTSFVSIILIAALTGCSVGNTNQMVKEAEYQKEIARIARYESNIPSNYAFFDYKDAALKLDALMFDPNATGPYLPLIWEDSTYQSFGIPAYVGDGRMHEDGAQEAVTAIAAVLSATLLGVDKSNQNGINYVEQLSAFYSEEEKIVLNNPSGNSETTSMWYLLYPAILFTQVSLHYPEETEIREQALNCIESWYQAYLVMREENSFDYTGFNFTSKKPYKNEIWTEPDSAAGIALLLYYGYELTGNQEYLDAGIYCIQYLSQYFGSPLYEALLYFGPYLASMYNAKFGTDINVEDMMDDVLSGASIPRGGWGSIVGSWGDYSMNGLMGSTSDGGGYAFAMNTFTAAYAMSPVAKYDTRYAASLGKWYLNVVGNARYFFADQTNIENQSAGSSQKAMEFKETVENIVPYEGIRKSQNSKTPWFGGDPTVYGWAETDFSLYSGAHIGMLASIVEETNVEAILKIDLNKADFFAQDYDTYLMYNPYSEDKNVVYRKTAKETVDLYNSITHEFVAHDVSGEQEISIPAEGAVVIVELPVGATVEHEGRTYRADGKVIAADAVSAVITNYNNNDTVSGNFKLNLECISTQENDAVKEIKVIINEEEKVYRSADELKFSVKEIGSGSKTFHIEVLMESGLKDETEIRLLLQ